jgi:cytochrome P450 family 142 subfamily A polypeptide 1
MMIDMDDPEHWSRRKLVNKGFTPRRVRDQTEQVRRACDEIIDSICEQGECDFVNDVAAMLPMIMIGDMLGVAAEDRRDLLRWSDDMLKSQSGSATEEMFLKAGEAYAEYNAYATAVIAARRGEPTDDLMSILVHAEVDGDRLSDDEILSESLLILIGGDETTRHVISQGVYELLRTGERDRLAADPSLLPTTVEEMLRWVSPIKNMARTVTVDTELGGEQLEAGQKLLLLYASANRDETVFDEPQRFDIGRTPNEHVAFGFGAHFCLGNSLARVEIATMVERLMERLPDLELVDDELPLRPANFVSGPEEMRVRFTPTKPLA